MDESKYTLDFLAWVNRCLFVDDFYKDLIDLGIYKEGAINLSSALFTNRNIVTLYQNQVVSSLDSDYEKRAIELYLNFMLEKYESYDKKKIK